MSLLLSIHIDGFFSNENAQSYMQQSDILYKMFGQLRHDIGAMLYLKADTYYHGGTKHLPKEEHVIGDELARYGDEHEHKPGSGYKAGEITPKGKRDIFSRINQAIKYRPVFHLKGEQESEILPWFYLATLVDPHYIQAYTVGGYWLGIRLEKPQQALKFLKKGLRYNPQSWPIYSQIGDIYFLVEKDYKKAIVYLNHAYLLMDNQGADVFEKKHTLIFLAVACEHLEDFPGALHYYEQLYKISKGDIGLKNKIDLLKDLIANGRISSNKGTRH